MDNLIKEDIIRFIEMYGELGFESEEELLFAALEHYRLHLRHTKTTHLGN